MAVGKWGAVQPWPLIGVHVALLPDGNVFSYGTSVAGMQGSHKIYDVWNPSTGLHVTSADALITDEFCSAEAIDPITDKMIIIGGDARPYGKVNLGVADFNIFDYTTNSLVASSEGQLKFPRWYPTLVALGNGEFLTLGGESGTGDGNATSFNGASGKGQAMPEIYLPGSGWHNLTGAYNAQMGIDWYYPRAWVSSNGSVYGYLAGSGSLFKITTEGKGSYEALGKTPFQAIAALPAAEFALDKILTIDLKGNAWVMDISGKAPTFKQIDGVGQSRYWSNLLDLADGTVLLTGGSRKNMDLPTATNNAMIWDPDTGKWSADSSAAIGRFYHSNTLLLPDATVLSVGGGAPGPLNNRNAEIYTPKYLLNPDGSLRNDRPVITDAPKSLQQGQTFDLHLDNANVIKKLELLKFGNATHSVDFEQRPFSLQFTHIDAHTLRVKIPANVNAVTDGYWMLFANNGNGTPSIAATIKISQVGVDTKAPSIAGTQFMLNGTASHSYGSNVYTLNADQAHQTGSVMSDKRLDLSQNFDLSFNVLSTGKAKAADGFAFVLHNDPLGNHAIGQGSGGLGAWGLKNGLAIQFDTYQNATFGDIAAAHAGIIATGDKNVSTFRLTPQAALVNLTNEKWHNVEVHWNAANKTLVYEFDGNQLQKLTLSNSDLLKYFGGSTFAYLGFTGATGGLSAQHQVQLNALNATFETTPLPTAPKPADGSIFDVTDVAQHVKLNGSATYLASENSFMLTPKAQAKTGGVTFKDKIDLTHNFNLNFDLYFDPNKPSDGVAFVLHNDQDGLNALGGTSANLGAVGLQNGLAIEFDTWSSAAPFNDPKFQHTSIVNTAGGPAGDLTAAASLGNIVDGGWHQVGVTWDVQTKTMKYWVDGKLDGSLAADLVNQYLGGQSTAYFGFTGATGGAAEVQKVRVAAIDAYLKGVSDGHSNIHDAGAVADNAVLNGAATYDSAHHTFVLTPDKDHVAGTAMLHDRIDLTHDFRLSFDAFFGKNAKGADGIALVLQNDAKGANALGVGGDGHGIFGIKNGVGIAFDTYSMEADGDMMGDHTHFVNTELALRASRISDEISIGGNAMYDKMTGMIDGGNVKDGKWHNVLVDWNANNHTLTYWFDGVQKGTLHENIIAKYEEGSQYAYLGFGAGTGAYHNLQQVHLNTLTATFETSANILV